VLISWDNFFSLLGVWPEIPEREKRDQVLGMAGREGEMKRNGTGPGKMIDPLNEKLRRREGGRWKESLIDAKKEKLRKEDILQGGSSRFRAS
jgi:hypothetical protein